MAFKLYGDNKKEQKQQSEFKILILHGEEMAMHLKKQMEKLKYLNNLTLFVIYRK